MDKCALCGKDLPPFTYREPHAKGFVCRKCAGGKDDKKGSDGGGGAPKPAPQAKKEEKPKKREVPGLSDAIDGLLKE